MRASRVAGWMEETGAPAGPRSWLYFFDAEGAGSPGDEPDGQGAGDEARRCGRVIEAAAICAYLADALRRGGDLQRRGSATAARAPTTAGWAAEAMDQRGGQRPWAAGGENEAGARSG